MVHIELKETVKQSLNDLEKRLDNLSDYFQDIVRPRLIQEIKKIFASQGYPTSWRSLDDETIKQKNRRYRGKGILRRTDRLYNSYIGVNRDEHISEVEEDNLILGSSVPYAHYHEEGTKTIPARPVLGQITESSQLERFYKTSLEKHINELI